MDSDEVLTIPDEVLRIARKATAELVDEGPMSYENQAAAGTELARAFQELDRWLNSGGFLPEEWKKHRTTYAHDIKTDGDLVNVINDILHYLKAGQPYSLMRVSFWRTVRAFVNQWRLGGDSHSYATLPPDHKEVAAQIETPAPQDSISKALNRAVKKGWGWPLNSKKAHYFLDGRSLCGAWLFMGDLEDNNHDSKDNCAGCRKRLKTVPGERT